MSDKPTILRYEDRRPRSSRWPWVLVGLIAVASCALYGSFLAGIISLEVMVGTIYAVGCPVIVITGVIAGIRYGTQRKDYWT